MGREGYAMDRGLSGADDYPGNDPNAEVVFSFVDGFVWVSRLGGKPMVRLGSYENVLAGMEDFIAQSELGKWLENRG
jgi:hypothetical protein